MTTRVRNLQPGQQFRLKRDTPGGTQYIVRRSGVAKPSTLHHSCHVVLEEKT